VSRSGDRLTIRNITYDDSGAYHCSAFGAGSGSAMTGPAIITVTTGVLSCNGEVAFDEITYLVKY